MAYKMTDALVSAQFAHALKKLLATTGYQGTGKDLGLRCPECKKAVEPFPDHFEHVHANPKCSLSSGGKGKNPGRGDQGELERQAPAPTEGTIL